MSEPNFRPAGLQAQICTHTFDLVWCRTGPRNESSQTDKFFRLGAWVLVEAVRRMWSSLEPRETPGGFHLFFWESSGEQWRQRWEFAHVTHNLCHYWSCSPRQAVGHGMQALGARIRDSSRTRDIDKRSEKDSHTERGQLVRQAERHINGQKGR